MLWQAWDGRSGHTLDQMAGAWLPWGDKTCRFSPKTTKMFLQWECRRCLWLMWLLPGPLRIQLQQDWPSADAQHHKDILLNFKATSSADDSDSFLLGFENSKSCVCARPGSPRQHQLCCSRTLAPNSILVLAKNPTSLRVIRSCT